MRSVLVIAFGVYVLALWLARAWSWRWIADDYCFATMTRHDGFWRGQALMYAKLNGRISVSFLMAVITSMGRLTTPSVAIVMMMAWLTGAWRAVHSVLKLLEAGASRLEEVAGAIVFVAVIIAVAPDSDQPLIWLLGLITYGLPIVCATWLPALVLQKRSSSQLAAVAALMFIAGGCSEVAAAAQIIFLTALMPLTKRFRAPLIAAIIASACALGFEFLSRGNAIRRGLFHPLPVPAAAAAALSGAPAVLATLLLQGSLPFALLIVYFAFAGERVKRVRPAVTIAALVTTVPIVAMTLFGGYYGTGRFPWARVQLVPVAYVTAALLVAGLGFRFTARPVVAAGLTAATALLAVFVVTSNVGDPLESMRQSRAFAVAADHVDQLAREQTAQPLVVSAPRQYDFLEFLSSDPDHWTNRCMADYYGLQSIRTPLPLDR